MGRQGWYILVVWRNSVETTFNLGKCFYIIREAALQATLWRSQITTRRFLYTHPQPIFCYKVYRETLWFLPYCHILLLYGKTLVRKRYLSNRLPTSAFLSQLLSLLRHVLLVGKLLRNCKLVYLYIKRLVHLYINRSLKKKKHHHCTLNFGDWLLDLI